MWFYIAPVYAPGAHCVIRASVLATVNAEPVWVFVDRDHWFCEFTTCFDPFLSLVYMLLTLAIVGINGISPERHIQNVVKGIAQVTNGSKWSRNAILSIESPVPA